MVPPLPTVASSSHRPTPQAPATPFPETVGPGVSPTTTPKLIPKPEGPATTPETPEGIQSQPGCLCVPWWLLALMAAIILLLFLYIWWDRRRRSNREED